MSKRRINLDKYGISQDRLDELRAICRQYGTLKKKSNAGELNARKKVEAIECALTTTTSRDPGMYKPLLTYLTRNIPFDQLEIPSNKMLFFEFRKAFYVNLDKLL